MTVGGALDQIDAQVGAVEYHLDPLPQLGGIDIGAAVDLLRGERGRVQAGGQQGLAVDQHGLAAHQHRGDAAAAGVEAQVQQHHLVAHLGPGRRGQQQGERGGQRPQAVRGPQPPHRRESAGRGATRVPPVSDSSSSTRTARAQAAAGTGCAGSGRRAPAST